MHTNPAPQGAALSSVPHQLAFPFTLFDPNQPLLLVPNEETETATNRPQ